MSEKPTVFAETPDVEGVAKEKAAKLKDHIASKYADKDIRILETRLVNIKGALNNPPRSNPDTIDPDWQREILNAETPEELKTPEAKMIVTDIIDAMEKVLKERRETEGL